MIDLIRVLVVDDHDFVRTQLVALMDSRDDIEVVGQCSSGEEVIGTAARVTPDVVVMDVQMGAMSGLAATRGLLAVQPKVRVLVLTASPSVTVQDAAATGASGLLLKGGDSDDLVAAVRTIAIGGTCWPTKPSL